MGFEASFQAIPEDCELLKQACQDREIAEHMQFFEQYVRREFPHPLYQQNTLEFIDAAKALAQAHPGLVERYFYAGARTWDCIIYLLSPERRAGNFKNDRSLINKAIRGTELLHPDAHAVQGIPIGFVPVTEVHAIADFLDNVTKEQLHEFYDPSRMYEMAVYKIHASDDERRFNTIWSEFCGMRDVYRQAALHNEAMITVID